MEVTKVGNEKGKKGENTDDRQTRKKEDLQDLERSSQELYATKSIFWLEREILVPNGRSTSKYLRLHCVVRLPLEIEHLVREKELISCLSSFHSLVGLHLHDFQVVKSYDTTRTAVLS